MRSETNFETTAHLPHGTAVAIVASGPDHSAIDDEVIAVTPDPAATDPKIRGKSRAVDWEPHGKRAEEATNAVITGLIEKLLAHIDELEADLKCAIAIGRMAANSSGYPKG